MLARRVFLFEHIHACYNGTLCGIQPRLLLEGHDLGPFYGEWVFCKR
jgi:hypothetical protein